LKRTEEKIVEVALELFNSEGVGNTTLRTIAQQVGISQGNLNYHYKTKSELVEQLYFDLVDKMDQHMRLLASGSIDLEFLYTTSRASMTLMYDYRFLLKDSLQVMRLSDKIQAHYMEVQRRRRVEFSQLFENLWQLDLIRNPEYDGEYLELHDKMNIVGDHWISTQELLNPDLDKPVEYYHRLLFGIIYPYLTRKGKRDYQRLMEIKVKKKGS
jgi:AcrR family transcriptional regulator